MQTGVKRLRRFSELDRHHFRHSYSPTQATNILINYKQTNLILTMGQHFSRERRWRNLDSSTPEEQKSFLSNHVPLKFEPVSSMDRNVRKADHLMVYRYGYTHHLICTSVQGDIITVMEYGIRNCFEKSAKEALQLLVDLEKLGEVHQKSFTFEELQTMKVS